MKNSINNLRNQLTTDEMLTPQRLYAIKGGGGEDIRRTVTTLIATATTIITAAVAAYKAKTS